MLICLVLKMAEIVVCGKTIRFIRILYLGLFTSFTPAQDLSQKTISGKLMHPSSV